MWKKSDSTKHFTRFRCLNEWYRVFVLMHEMRIVHHLEKLSSFAHENTFLHLEDSNATGVHLSPRRWSTMSEVAAKMKRRLCVQLSCSHLRVKQLETVESRLPSRLIRLRLAIYMDYNFRKNVAHSKISTAWEYVFQVGEMGGRVGWRCYIPVTSRLGWKIIETTCCSQRRWMAADARSETRSRESGDRCLDCWRAPVLLFAFMEMWFFVVWLYRWNLAGIWILW